MAVSADRSVPRGRLPRFDLETSGAASAGGGCQRASEGKGGRTWSRGYRPCASGSCPHFWTPSSRSDRASRRCVRLDLMRGTPRASWIGTRGSRGSPSVRRKSSHTRGRMPTADTRTADHFENRPRRLLGTRERALARILSRGREKGSTFAFALVSSRRSPAAYASASGGVVWRRPRASRPQQRHCWHPPTGTFAPHDGARRAPLRGRADGQERDDLAHRVRELQVRVPPSARREFRATRSARVPSRATPPDLSRTSR